MTKQPVAYTQPSVLARIASGEDWNSYIWGERDETDEAFKLAIPHPENAVPLYTLSGDELARLATPDNAVSAIRPEMVRELDWKQDFGTELYADSIVGRYQIHGNFELGYCVLCHGTNISRSCNTEDDARVAAQHDFRSRVEASISPVFIERIGALEADKARLDFLDEANRRLNANYGTTYKWRVIMNHNVNRLMLGAGKVDLNDMEANGLPSCRGAIDAALARTTQEPTNAEDGERQGDEG